MRLLYQRMCERLGDNPARTILQRLAVNRKSGNQVSVLADEGALAGGQADADAGAPRNSLGVGWVARIFFCTLAASAAQVSDGFRTSHGNCSEGTITGTLTALAAR